MSGQLGDAGPTRSATAPWDAASPGYRGAKAERFMQTDAAWKKWGEQDAYYAVLTLEKLRRASFDQFRDEFFESGEIDIRERLAIIGRLYGPLPRHRAVDFGCGVGRLTIPLSHRYAKVIGVDISPAMISEAEKNCRQFGAQAVTFCQKANEITPNSVDLVTSIIVLQHIRVKQGLKIIEDLLDTLVVGAVAALDVTVYHKFPMKHEIVYRIKHGIPGAWVLLNLIHGKRLSEPPMEMNEYPLDTVLEIYHRKGMDNIVLQPVFGSSLGFTVMGQRGR